jgi:hypothetical protein
MNRSPGGLVPLAVAASREENPEWQLQISKKPAMASQSRVFCWNSAAWVGGARKRQGNERKL